MQYLNKNVSGGALKNWPISLSSYLFNDARRGTRLNMNINYTVSVLVMLRVGEAILNFHALRAKELRKEKAW